MVLTASYFHDVVALAWIKVLDPSGNTAVELVANSELPMVVKAPCEQLLLVVYVETMLISAKDVCRIFCANFLDFKRLIIFVSGVQHTAYFA